jgi:hypothetical protein
MTSPRNAPALTATPLMPSARPRWLPGNPSVMMRSSPAGECRHREQHREQREHRASEVVRPDSAEHAPETAARGDEQRQHDQIAENHPQEVVRVARRRRIDVDATGRCRVAR